MLPEKELLKRLTHGIIMIYRHFQTKMVLFVNELCIFFALMNQSKFFGAKKCNSINRAFFVLYSIIVIRFEFFFFFSFSFYIVVIEFIEIENNNNIKCGGGNAQRVSPCGGKKASNTPHNESQVSFRVGRSEEAEGTER